MGVCCKVFDQIECNSPNPPLVDIGGSHINRRGEQVPARMLVPEGGDCEIPHRLEREMKYSF